MIYLRANSWGRESRRTRARINERRGRRLPDMPTQPKRFGARLRWWRARRGLSQLDLAGAAGTSQRHLSFLESGRTAPGRAMVLGLAAALDLPLRQQNALLLAAGFAPVWRESELTAPALVR